MKLRIILLLMLVMEEVAFLSATTVGVKNETDLPAHVTLSIDPQMDPHWCSDIDFSLPAHGEHKIDFASHNCPLQRIKAVAGNYGPYDVEKDRSTVSWSTQGQGVSGSSNFVIKGPKDGHFTLDLVK